MFWRKKILEAGPVTVTAEVEVKEEVKDPLASQQFDENRPRYPEREVDIVAAHNATRDWNNKADEALKVYVSTDPEYKIVQLDSGPYVIKRRKIEAEYKSYQEYYLDRGYMHLYSYRFKPWLPWADQIEADTDFTPITTYESVLDYSSPKMSYRAGYSKYDRGGFNVLTFNVFQDAEDYLGRMVRQPEEKETGYNVIKA